MEARHVLRLTRRLTNPFRRQVGAVPLGAARYAVGLMVSSTGGAMHAALVRDDRSPTEDRVKVVANRSIRVPNEVAATIAQLSGELVASPLMAAIIGSELVETQAALVDEVARSAGVDSAHVAAVGVHDPGLWHFSESGTPAYVSISDAAKLAERTGMNVIDAFPARDLACGGQGGPVTPIGEWMLLCDGRRRRALIELGRSVRLTILPPACAGPGGIVSFHVGPGTALLDLLARQLTSGSESFDSGGRLAAQGRRIGPLLEHWLADPYFKRPLPRWHPWGIRPERFYTESVQMAIDAGWSVRDLLCTASHLIAETIRLALERLPAMPPWEEVVVCGGGQQNGMLLREIALRIGPARLIRSSELGIAPQAVTAAATAVLALLYIDQVPASLVPVTGAREPRVLGRLTVARPDDATRGAIAGFNSSGSIALRPAG